MPYCFVPSSPCAQVSQFSVGALEHFVVWCNFVEATMPKVRTDGMPAYKRIQDAIVKRLESGQLKAGDTVRFRINVGM